MVTFDLIAADGLDGYVHTVDLRIPAEHIPELPASDLRLQHVYVHRFRHSILYVISIVQPIIPNCLIERATDIIPSAVWPACPLGCASGGSPPHSRSGSPAYFSPGPGPTGPPALVGLLLGPGTLLLARSQRCFWLTT